MLDLSAIRVLTVDDNQNMLSIIKYSLRALGVRNIQATHDVEKAYILYKEKHPDIIITNWMMDNIKGLAFTKKIRSAKDSNNKQIPIIMLSAYSELHRITKARDTGVTEFLVKPVSPKAIYLRLSQVIQKPRQFIESKVFFDLTDVD